MTTVREPPSSQPLPLDNVLVQDTAGKKLKSIQVSGDNGGTHRIGDSVNPAITGNVTNTAARNGDHKLDESRRDGYHLVLRGRNHGG